MPLRSPYPALREVLSEAAVENTAELVDFFSPRNPDCKMSSSLETRDESGEKSSKKRKHADGGKESNKKKKRKQSDQTDETNGMEPAMNTSELRKHKKRDRSQEIERPQQSEIAQIVTPSHSSLVSPDEQRRKERKQKTRKEGEVNGLENDVELPDAPVVEEEEKVEFWTAEEVPTATVDAELSYQSPSSFHSKRISLYLPIPPVGLDKTVSAVLALHVTPLLLTYFPPAEGVVLSIHDPILSATPQASLNLPLLPPQNLQSLQNIDEAYPRVGDEFGACWAWLTVTFLVYSPQPGDELHGWINAMSEGFVGLVCYNYFQTSIAKSRIPKEWTWDGPSRAPRQRKTPRKGKLNDGEQPSQEGQSDSQETIVAVREDDAFDGNAGTFLDENKNRIPEQLRFRVVDLEMIPAQERGQLALQVEGTLLSADEEARTRNEERQKFEMKVERLKIRSKAPVTPSMSGALPSHSRSGSTVPS